MSAGTITIATCMTQTVASAIRTATAIIRARTIMGRRKAARSKGLAVWRVTAAAINIARVMITIMVTVMVTVTVTVTVTITTATITTVTAILTAMTTAAQATNRGSPSPWALRRA
ncbi:hypothetical protein GCM10027018_18500 [Paenibacillus thermoaerophilus]